MRIHSLGSLVILVFVALGIAGAQPKVVTHTPTRPVPTATPREMNSGPAFFVDPNKGDDANPGSKENPWKTLAHAVKQLKPGDTLYLHGGTYYEHVTLNVRGTPDKPITIRAMPMELPILDGGIREFYENPAKAWEPCPDGVEGEYRSTKTYPDLGAGEKGVNAHAYFGDSMVPLQAYRYLKDLRDPSMIWDIKNKTSDEEGGVYCGPGVYYDFKSGRFHARLAHTDLKALGDNNYTGPTDPRKVPLVLSAWRNGPTLTLHGASDVILQDLVVRGSITATVEIADSTRITLEGLTVYSGQTALRVRDTSGLRMLHCACRGIAAPWTFRGHLKYRSTEARLFSAGGWSPTGHDNRDFELAYCEFTDSVDGVFVGNVKGVRFHHNLLDNISDDGIFLTSTTGYDGTTFGGDVHIHQNVLSRCLTTLAFGVGHGRQKVLSNGKQTGSGVYVYRNVFDFRRPVMYHFPNDPKTAEELPSKGRFASDHGNPAWEPMNIYHNTLIADDGLRYHYGTSGLGHDRQRVFNNIVVQLDKFPSLALLTAKTDLQADGNLFWSDKQGAALDFLQKVRQSKVFAESKERYAPGWMAHDVFADPKFTKFNADWKTPLDLTLTKGSPAIDAGVPIPAEWPDPLRKQDKDKPDLGALPLDGETWRVGVHRRLTMFGESKPPEGKFIYTPSKFAVVSALAYRTDVKPAAIVAGYPEVDAPVVEYLLKRQDVRVEMRERRWLDVADYAKYGLVVIAGDLRRAMTEPNKYSKEELEKVDKFLKDGGTLLLLRRGKRVFDSSPEGAKYLEGITGRQAEREKEPKITIAEASHSWVKHLDAKKAYPWLTFKPDNDNAPLRVTKGEQIIASAGGTCLLYRVGVGKGQIIYMGWQAADSLPHGREKSTVEEETAWEEQMQILANIVTTVYPQRGR